MTMAARNPVAAGASTVSPFMGHYTFGAFAAFLVAAVTLVLVWALLNKISPWDDNVEMFQRKNTGFTVVRTMQVIGLGYALAPVIGYTTERWWQQAVWAAVDAVWIVVLLLLVSRAVTALVEQTHGGVNAIRNCNTQVGLVTGMFYIAFGLVIGATLPGPSLLGVVRTFEISTTFSLLGMGFILAVYLVFAHVRVFRYTSGDEASSGTPYSLSRYIMDEDWPATILATTLIWTFGVVTSSAVAGTFTSWADSIVTFAVAAAIMVALTSVTMWLVDKFVVTNDTTRSMIEKGLWHPALVMSGFLFAVSIFASYVVS